MESFVTDQTIFSYRQPNVGQKKINIIVISILPLNKMSFNLKKSGKQTKICKVSKILWQFYDTWKMFRLNLIGQIIWDKFYTKGLFYLYITCRLSEKNQIIVCLTQLKGIPWLVLAIALLFDDIYGSISASNTTKITIFKLKFVMLIQQYLRVIQISLI